MNLDPLRDGAPVADVIVPVLNEAENLPELLRRLRALPVRVHPIFVDNGSTDRTLEILRSPSLLHDYHELEQALGELPTMGAHLARIFPPALQSRLYALALARFYVDEGLDTAVTGWARLAMGLDSLERRFTTWLG